MNWRRLAWLLMLLLIAVIVWQVVGLRETYRGIASAKLEDTDNASRSLVPLQKRITSHRERIQKLESRVLWRPEVELMSWLTQQASDSHVRIIGVEQLPVEKLSEYQHIPVKITVRGDYNPLGRFINKLEHSPNAVRIDSFRMRHKEYMPDRVTMDLSLSYFRKADNRREVATTEETATWQN